jgi:hypothetical protein
MDLQFQRDQSFKTSQEQAIAAQRAEWESQLKADPEIGSKLPQVQQDIGRALTHMDPKLRQAFQTEMNATGIGNNPVFVKAFYSLAQKLNEGTHVTGGGPAPVKDSSRPSAAASMYPHLAR